MAKPTAAVKDKDAKLKQHKRSRSGCFTCRLRRKKCDEGKPTCTACHHLGLSCDYKRPPWWGNLEQRRYRKDYIKEAIRTTQLAKKAEMTGHPARTRVGTDTPPSLCHYASTPEGSASSPPPPYSNFMPMLTDAEPLCIAQDHQDSAHNDYYAIPHEHQSMCCPVQAGSPIDCLDYSTNQDTYLNDSTFRRDSALSLSYPSLCVPDLDASDGLNAWTEQGCFQSPDELIAHGSEMNTFPLPDDLGDHEAEMDTFPLPNEDWLPAPEAKTMPVVDKAVMAHFVDNVSHLIYPILDATQEGSARTQVVLPALDTNPSFVHCCMSVAALHLKSSNMDQAMQIDNDILNHRCDAVGIVCEALEHDKDHEEALETTLGLILYPTCAGTADETLIDIPWHEHFKIVKNLVESLSIQKTILSADLFDPEHNTFAATLTAWIDILGATIRGKAPVFADTWLDLMDDNRDIGLSDVMGCQDRVMYIISEIAVLEERKRTGVLNDLEVCNYIEALGFELTSTDPPSLQLDPAVAADGSIIPSQLVHNITLMFRLAARVLLVSLVPDYAHDGQLVVNMVNSFTNMMSQIPSQFTPSLAWPLLIVGHMSTPSSPFRAMLAGRMAMLGPRGEQGSLARVNALLCSTWATNDFAGEATGLPRVHWREVMAARGADWLLL